MIPGEAAVLVLGLVVAGWLWLSGAVLAGWVAAQKHRSEWGWFFIGLLFSPVLSLLALAAVPPLRPLRHEEAFDVDLR